MKAIYILLFLYSVKCFGQKENFVINGSFENYDTCPSFNKSFTVKNWVSPNLSTPDYYNMDCHGERDYFIFKGAPKGIFSAHSGNGYVGIFSITPQGYMEHVQGKLKSPLIKGKKYRIKFYAFFLRSCSPFSTYKLGALVSESAILKNNSHQGLYQLSMTPELTATMENPKDSFLVSEEWKLVTGDFIAKGGEEYITIGCFYENNKLIQKQSKNFFKKYADKNHSIIPAIKKILLLPNQPIDEVNSNIFKEGAYYFIDDVELIEAQE